MTISESKILNQNLGCKEVLLDCKEYDYVVLVVLFTWQEKNETAQKQLDALLYSKRQKITENTASDTATVSSSLESPVKQAAQLPSTKVTNRVVPAHRRARVRGVLLHDTEEERQD
uniref:Uncharacterized protein n=1 Tax=Solanum tuberosum TaxID=4113 RepID=M1AXS3_SOLTU